MGQDNSTPVQTHPRSNARCVNIIMFTSARCIDHKRDAVTQDPAINVQASDNAWSTASALVDNTASKNVWVIRWNTPTEMMQN